MAKAVGRLEIADRVKAAMYGICIGDALSMPVHWYYNPRDIGRDYGGVVRDYLKPKERHPSSILNLSNTGGAGRGGQSGNIIGDVINHGKKHYWLVPGTHYHVTLAAGENTLNAQCARLVARTITRDGAYTPAAFLKAYVEFMTTPGSHNDTYAETFHRMFFKNLVAGKKAEDCADDDGHNVSSMGGFVMLPPVALFTAAGGGDVASTRAATVAQMYLTHNSHALAKHAGVYAELLHTVVNGGDLRSAVAAAGSAIGVNIPKLVASSHGSGADTDVIGGVFSSACYIEGSFPSLLYLAYKYSDSPEAAIIANTNAGGENCHRGSALGALMGAAHGMAGWPARWVTGLHDAAAIEKEATAFAALAAGVDAAAMVVGHGASVATACDASTAATG